MKTIRTPLALLLIFGLVLASCTIGSEPEAAINDLPAVDVTATLSLAQSVVIELSATADTSVQYTTVGQLVKFKYTLKMVKNDTVNVPANLTFTGAAPVCPAFTTIGNLNDRLDAGEILDCAFDYPLTQADLDRASISNVVTATAYTVNSNTVTTNVATVPSKLITLTKTANPTTYSGAGQLITYTYTIKNSGSTALGPGQFTVADTAVNNNAPFNCGDLNAVIAPGATLACNAAYTTTSNDAAAVSIASNAVATGGGANPSQPASVTVTKAAVAKGATVQHTVADGEWLWQIARCYGADPEATVGANKQLADPAKIKAGMVVNVPNIGSAGDIHAPAQACVTKHVVQTGETWTSIADKYGADPGLTQFVNGNLLTVGKEVKVPLYTKGLNIPLIGTTPTTQPTTALTLTVTADKTTYSQTGEVITFNYLVKNTGTVNLGPVQFTVTDILVNPAAFNCGAPSTLIPGGTVSCSGKYTITQNDLAKDSILNSATAGGTGVPTSLAAGQKITKTITLLTLTVTASPTTYTAAGQVITFNYVITNGGATVLGPAQFVITDPLVNPAPFNCGAADATLASTQSLNCSASYTITAEDMQKDSIINGATASGGGAPASQQAGQKITRQ